MNIKQQLYSVPLTLYELQTVNLQRSIKYKLQIKFS